MLDGEAGNVHFIVSVLTWTGFNSAIYHKYTYVKCTYITVIIMLINIHNLCNTKMLPYIIIFSGCIVLCPAAGMLGYIILAQHVLNYKHYLFNWYAVGQGDQLLLLSSKYCNGQYLWPHVDGYIYVTIIQFNCGHLATWRVSYLVIVIRSSIPPIIKHSNSIRFYSVEGVTYKGRSLF